MNVAEKMRELIPILRMGFNEVPMPEIKPECQEEWSEDYAIAQHMYWDMDHPYFDDCQFRFDLEEFVKKFFGPGAIVLHDHCRDATPDKDLIVIRFYYGSQELEVYRLKAGSHAQDAQGSVTTGHEKNS